METRGLRALKIQPQFSGLNPMGKRAEWVFGIANDYRLPVVFHTGSGATFALPSLLIPVARQYPEPPVSVAHRGGPTCYLEAIVPARLCPNLLLVFPLHFAQGNVQRKFLASGEGQCFAEDSIL